MPYATLDDLKKILNEAVLIDLTDDAGAGVIDSAVVDNSLEAADVEIDAYLGERYSLPLSPAPAIVAKLAGDLAVFNLYSRREGPPDHWQARYNNVIKMLAKIQAGDIGLGIGDPAATASDGAEIVSEDRIFTRDTLKNF
jgi:phage gp36-like protein